MKQFRKKIEGMLAEMRCELDNELAAIVAECKQKSDDFTADGEEQI
jgi:hypothetical protein